MTESTRNMVTRQGRAIRPTDRLTYTPAVELSYLGEMVKLDHEELTEVYISIMEFSLTTSIGITFNYL